MFTRLGNNSYIDQQTLPTPITGRYIRFHPITQKYWNNFRVEVYEGIFFFISLSINQAMSPKLSESKRNTLVAVKLYIAASLKMENVIESRKLERFDTARV